MTATASTLRAVLVLIAVLAFAVSPLVFQPFMGWRPDQFPVPIARHPVQPAGYAFSIWGLIYLWLVVHGAFGLWRRRADAAWDAPRIPLAISALIGTVWMPVAHASPLWGTLTIWPMAAAALTAFVLCDPTRDRWLLAAPLALLAGWLSAASAVATGVFLAGHGVLAPVPAAFVMLAVVLLIAVPVQRQRPAMPLYGLTVIWALAGIVAVNRTETPSVAIAAAIGIVAMAAAILLPRRA